MKAPKYVVISGGIAVGKTTLATQLSQLISDCQTFIEYPELNPYLADFYEDMQRWAFHSRIAMLAMFAAHYTSFEPSRRIILSDRTFHELITFANMHMERGNLSRRDYEIYRMLYDSFMTLAPPLDCVVYLSCSGPTALQRIAQRHRPFERHVTETYLADVNEHYERWLASLSSTVRILRYNTDDGVDAGSIMMDIEEVIRQ
jgi:deoxyadenosine/deoxycytidine kinase